MLQDIAGLLAPIADIHVESGFGASDITPLISEGILEPDWYLMTANIFGATIQMPIQLTNLIKTSLIAASLSWLPSPKSRHKWTTGFRDKDYETRHCSLSPVS